MFFISAVLEVFGRNESWDTSCQRRRIFDLEQLHGSVFLACYMNGYIETRERRPCGGDDGAQFFPVSAYCCMRLQIFWIVNQPRVCDASRDCHYQQSHEVNGYMTAGENREMQ